MARGKFITLEGGEGAGKSTQAKKLAAFLRRRGIKVVLTREVGGSKGAELIRKLWLSQKEGYWDPVAELLLIFAARREHLTKTVWPALKAGKWVVSDRFMDSTRAYQGIGHHVLPAQIERLYYEAAGDFEPDLTILLDMPVEASMGRVKKRGGWHDRYQLKAAPFHRKLRAAYKALAKKYPKRIKVVNASGDVDDVAANVAAVMQKHFGFRK
ncbi:MAG TPA: dTMP kinase [Alphaproteobacteria bacterium]|nr:dTMP kinase [Alphaproteobacteria bacterium]